MLGDEQNKGLIGRAVEALFVAKHDIEVISPKWLEIRNVETIEIPFRNSCFASVKFS